MDIISANRVNAVGIEKRILIKNVETMRKSVLSWKTAMVGVAA